MNQQLVWNVFNCICFSSFPIPLHCIMYLDLSNKLGFWAQIPKPTPDPPLFASCEQSPEQWTQINPPAFSAQPGNSTSILQVFGQSLIFLSVQHFGNRHHWKKLDIVNLKWLQLGSITKALIVLRLHTMLGCQEDLMPVASMWLVTICAHKSPEQLDYLPPRMLAGTLDMKQISKTS